MDTHAHARRIEHLFGLGNGSCGSVWVGAETEHFSSSLLASRTGARPMHVLFYGQFIPLHGVDTVIRAARLLRNEPVEWQIIGQGQVAPCIRSEEHTSELQSLMRISYAVFCLKKKN